MDRIHQCLPGDVHVASQKANAHSYRNILAEQHGEKAGVRQTRFELLANMPEQLKNIISERLVMKFMLQLHKATDMSLAEMWERMGAIENQAEQKWTSHQVTLLNEMKCRKRTHWKTERRILLSVSQRQNFGGIEGKVARICKNISRVSGATCQKFKQKVRVEQVASRERS